MLKPNSNRRLVKHVLNSKANPAMTEHAGARFHGPVVMPHSAVYLHESSPTGPFVSAITNAPRRPSP